MRQPLERVCRRKWASQCLLGLESGLQQLSVGAFQTGKGGLMIVREAARKKYELLNCVIADAAWKWERERNNLRSSCAKTSKCKVTKKNIGREEGSQRSLHRWSSFGLRVLGFGLSAFGFGSPKAESRKLKAVELELRLLAARYCGLFHTASCLSSREQSQQKRTNRLLSSIVYPLRLLLASASLSSNQRLLFRPEAALQVRRVGGQNKLAGLRRNIFSPS